MECLRNDQCPLLVKLFSAGSAFCFGISAVTNFILSFKHLGYTAGAVNLFCLFISIVALLCEISPFCHKILMTSAAFLGVYRDRGLLYFWIGFFTLGKEMQWFGLTSGILMIVSGALNILMHYAGDISPRTMGYGEAASPGRFDRYEDDESQQYAPMT
eukprot:GHVS01030946.1.p1 GENE.GHVS01030946.1~~GHVS01030946.1.p1  ORF type:complete len:158 (-),score=6.17 GHVS01030946.1:48-521(-)